MQNAVSLRQRLAAGNTVSGMILFSGSPMLVEMMAAAGVDFVVIDMEHSALDLDTAAHVIRAADAAGVTPFVRIPEVDAALVKKLLNLGAAGLALPHANRDNCAALLRAMRYAPEGDRGACPMVRAAGYTRGDWSAYAARANREVMAIPLLEDAASIEDFEALAAMPGLDVFFIGPTDLSISLGVPGASFDEPAMSAALDSVVARARQHGKVVMTTIGNRLEIDYGQRVAARGVQMIVYGTDGDLFTDAMRRLAPIKG
ncbi:MAG: HpcH/HpaI aldolase family protein [Burkholderiales bacterium]